MNLKNVEEFPVTTYCYSPYDTSTFWIKNTDHFFSYLTDLLFRFIIQWFNRELRTRFDLLKESKVEINAERQIKNYSETRKVLFDVGDTVWIRDYKCPNKPTWVKAQVVEGLGDRNYFCKTLIEKRVCKRHVDQMRKAGILISSELFDPKESVQGFNPTYNEIPVVQERVIPSIGDESVHKEPVLETDNETESGENKIEVGHDVEKSVNNEALKDVNGNPGIVALNINERPKRVIKPVQRLNL